MGRCPYHCIVEAEFLPRACLNTPLFEEWQEAIEETEELKPDPDLRCYAEKGS